MRRYYKPPISTRCSKINDILRSFNRSENMELFLAISNNYSFYKNMCDDHEVEYFFKLDQPERNPNKTFDLDEIKIGIYGKKKLYNEFGELVYGSGYESINYVQGSRDREAWFGTINGVLRNRKLEEILK